MTDSQDTKRCPECGAPLDTEQLGSFTNLLGEEQAVTRLCCHYCLWDERDGWDSDKAGSA